MSEEVIKILDALAEKFGLAIDWTSANVLPYLQQLCGKYVTYEIATSVVWMIIGICLLFLGRFCIGKTKYYCQKYCEETDFCTYDDIAFAFGFVAAIAIVLGVAFVLSQTFDIVTCITFPEKIIFDEIQSIYESMK